MAGEGLTMVAYQFGGSIPDFTFAFSTTLLGSDTALVKSGGVAIPLFTNFGCTNPATGMTGGTVSGTTVVATTSGFVPEWTGPDGATKLYGRNASGEVITFHAWVDDSLITRIAALEGGGIPGTISADSVTVGSTWTSVTLTERAAITSMGTTKADLDGGTGKLSASQIPLNILPRVWLGDVASQALMLALTGKQGDWCTRTDTNTTWELKGSPATSIGSWKQQLTPAGTDVLAFLAANYVEIGQPAVGGVYPNRKAYLGPVRWEGSTAQVGGGTTAGGTPLGVSGLDRWLRTP